MSGVRDRSGRFTRLYQPSPARAAAIAQAREQAHMSQYDLAGVLGVSRESVAAWEACRRDPGPELAARIAVVTRVPVSWLLAPSYSRHTVRPSERRAAA